jgi:hypothetical protein
VHRWKDTHGWTYTARGGTKGWVRMNKGEHEQVDGVHIGSGR